MFGSDVIGCRVTHPAAKPAQARAHSVMSILVLPTSAVRRTSARGAARRSHRDETDLHRSRDGAARRHRGDSRVQARGGHRVAVSRTAVRRLRGRRRRRAARNARSCRARADRARGRSAAGQRMAQYVALMALRHLRELPRLETQQREARWNRPPPAAEVGIRGRRHGLRLDRRAGRRRPVAPRFSGRRLDADRARDRRRRVVRGRRTR